MCIRDSQRAQSNVEQQNEQKDVQRVLERRRQDAVPFLVLVAVHSAAAALSLIHIYRGAGLMPEALGAVLRFGFAQAGFNRCLLYTSSPLPS